MPGEDLGRLYDLHSLGATSAPDDLDAEDRRLVSGLAPGHYTLVARAPGHGTSWTEVHLTTTRAEAHIELEPSRTVELLVLGLTDDGEAPVPGARVSIATTA